LGRISGVNGIGRLTDIIVDEMPFDYLSKIKYVEMPNPMNRIKLIIEDLNKEMETVKLENSLEESLKEKLDEEQKNYILREKIRLIKEELNEVDIKDSDVVKLKKKIERMDMPSRIKDRLEDEITRYEFTTSTSPEISIVRNYIDWLINLPWKKNTRDNNDIDDIRKKLNDTHCGLDDVKERIVEYIAINKRNKSSKVPILCLIGPPGTGKTSMAKSIANAISRKFVKISVGGVHDEGEIIGHRRTYMGANPGKIIQGIKKAGVNNPVFLIDEIDKLTKDYKGDPGSALLDVLDREQNYIFQDNYIEEEFDLSNVLFILTGNNEENIPSALKDRLEIIHLSGYTLNEKIEMVNNYIVPRLKKEYNFENIKFSKNSIKDIILYYTMENGVRELERCFDRIFRRVIIDNEISSSDEYVVDDVTKYLGNYKYKYMHNDKGNEIGVINTLGYTSFGGCLLKTTSVMYVGNGNIQLTGCLGDIIKESIYVAIGYIKNNCNLLDINNEIFSLNDFHIHFESGAIFKEGPSAGVALITSLISLIKKKPISNEVSMTGEITLRGKILPVGGIKEKILVAINNNIKTIYVPLDNKGDVKEINKELIKGIKIKYIDNYLELYNDLF
jgi:ATP-dependent Lon protease